MYSPLCHISIFWCFICMHTTESFRINQPARSILKAPGQISAQRDIHGSFLNFTLECIWRKWNVFPEVRDQDFFLIILKTFRLEEMTSAKQKAISILSAQTLAPELLIHLFQFFLGNSLFEWDLATSRELLSYPTQERGSNNWSLPNLQITYQWAKSLQAQRENFNYASDCLKSIKLGGRTKAALPFTAVCHYSCPSFYLEASPIAFWITKPVAEAPLVAQTVESVCNAGDPGSIPEMERSPGEGNGNLLQ